MNLKPFLGAVLVLSVVGLSSTNIWAHGGATGIVKERMDAMSDMKKSMKSLSSMFKGRTAYDADDVRTVAKALEHSSGDAMTKLFPEGSVHGPSEAKMTIWQEWQRFQQMADELKVYSRALSEAADRYPAANTKPAAASLKATPSMEVGSSDLPEHLAEMPTKMLFKKVADTCSSCHKHFRID